MRGSYGTASKVELYIVSLWLLFILVVVITLDVPLCTGSDCTFIGWQVLLERNVIPGCGLLLLLLGAFFYLRFWYVLRGSTELPLTITRIENINFEHLTFLTTYIIPLICFDLSNTRYAVVLLVLLVFIGAIYVKTDMFYANPSLALLGYHIYRADAESRVGPKTGIVLITRDRLAAGDKAHYRKLDERIYYVKVVHDES